MLDVQQTILVLIDIQEKLSRVMHQRETLIKNVQTLVRGIRVLEIPILWAEQNPNGLGPTVPEIAELLSDFQPLQKRCFSCCHQEEFVQALKHTQRQQILISGIETHICVYQTAMDLCHLGYDVQVVVDAVSSRTPENTQIGLERLRQTGVTLTSTEMALFELLKVAEGPKFKEILKIVK